MPGRFLVDRVDDIVIIVQEGYFDTVLIDAMLDAIEEVSPSVEGASYQHVAIIHELSGASLIARLHFERGQRRIARYVRRIAVIARPNLGYRLARACGELIPNTRHFFAWSLADGIAGLGRQASMLADIEARIAQGSWVTRASLEATA